MEHLIPIMYSSHQFGMIHRYVYASFFFCFASSPPPVPPGEVNHTMVTRELLTLQSVRLTWMQPEDNNGHISSYNITYCILVNSTCGRQTSFQTLSFTEMVILSQLIPARTYQVYIQAENDVGQGPEPTQPFFFKSANQSEQCFYSTSNPHDDGNVCGSLPF